MNDVPYRRAYIEGRDAENRQCPNCEQATMTPRIWFEKDAQGRDQGRTRWVCPQCSHREEA